MCQQCKDERFHTEIAIDENTPGVKTAYTMQELNDTIYAIGLHALKTKDDAALRTASAIAFLVKQNQDFAKKAGYHEARHSVFTEEVTKALDMGSLSEVKAHIRDCLSSDTLVSLFEGVSLDN